MRRSLVLLTLAAFLPATVAFAAAEALPVDEAAIIAEVEALIESTPPLDEEGRKAVQELLRKGVEAHDARRYDKAIEYYRKAIEIGPLTASAYYELAYSLSASGDQVAALDAVLRALVLDPKQEVFYIFQASILDDLGYSARAEKAYRDLLAIQPNSYMGHVNLAVTLHRANRLDDAEAALLRAVEIDPDGPSAYFHLALLSETRGYGYDEERYLEKFLEVGSRDVRFESAKQRLEELRRQNIPFDASQRYASIDLAETMIRTAWRSELHRKAFPDARGYELTFEEDREAYTTILPMWRKIKREDPSATEGRYDLLLKIDDAGFLDEYIWYHRQSVFGDRAKAWMAEHPDRMTAFLEWARAEGLLSDESAKPSLSPLDELRALPAALLETVSASPLVYEIGSEPSRPTALLEQERARFSKTFALVGADRVECRKVMRILDGALMSVGARAVIPAFRCFRPGDEEYAVAARRVSPLALEAVEIEFRPTGEVTQDEKVHVDVSDAPWLMYVLAKAAWRNEPALRERYGGAKDAARASLEEELFATGVLAGAYANSLEPDEANPDEAEPVRRPELDRLLEAVEAGRLRAYVLYEVIHKAYGIRLERLDEPDANGLEEYVFGYVLRLKKVE